MEKEVFYYMTYSNIVMVDEQKQKEMKQKMQRLIEKLKEKGIQAERITYKKRAY